MTERRGAAGPLGRWAVAERWDSAVKKHVRRIAIPAAVVAGVAAAGAGVWPALASAGDPDLPEVTAEELLVRVAESETAQLSGTVRVDAGLDGALGDFAAQLAGQFGGPAGQLADLATGDATLSVALDGPERQRLAVVSGSEELSLIHNDGQLWGYDSASNTVYRSEVPEDAGAPAGGAAHGLERFGDLTPQQAAQRLLEDVAEYADVSVDGTAKVAGRDAYQLLVEPTEAAAPDAGPAGGQIESARISVDAGTGVPLAVTVRNASGPALDMAFAQIDYSQPAGGTFEFTPPADADIVDLDLNAPMAGLTPGDLLSGLGLEGLDLSGLDLEGVVPEDVDLEAELDGLDLEAELAELEEELGQLPG